MAVGLREYGSAGGSDLPRSERIWTGVAQASGLVSIGTRRRADLKPPLFFPLQQHSIPRLGLPDSCSPRLLFPPALEVANGELLLALHSARRRRTSRGLSYTLASV